MAETTIKLKPWQVPNFAVPEVPAGKRQDGWAALDGIHVRELSAETLAQMADEWRAELFRKAGKDDPQDKRAKAMRRAAALSIAADG